MGQGINFSIIFFSIGLEIIPYLLISFLSQTCTIRGLFAGLFFSINIFSKAFVFKAFAQSP
jgi:hypothetical protein